MLASKYRLHSMSNWEDVLAFDATDPLEVRADFLVEQDDALIESLIKIRKSKKLTQQQVAERLGLTQATVAAFERADNDPKLSTIRRYAMAVEALVNHDVQADEGQLLGTGGSRWVSRSQMPFRGHVDNLKSSQPWTRFNVIAAESSRFDFALAG